MTSFSTSWVTHQKLSSPAQARFLPLFHMIALLAPECVFLHRYMTTLCGVDRQWEVMEVEDFQWHSREADL